MPVSGSFRGGNFPAVTLGSSDEAEALAHSLPGVDPSSALCCYPLKRLCWRQEVFMLAHQQLFMEHLTWDQSYARCGS